MLLSDVCLSCMLRTSGLTREERPMKTKIGTVVAHVTHDSDTTFKVKGQGHQAALVGCTGRPTWTYSNGALSICVHDVYRVTTWQAWAGAYRGGRPSTACYICRQAEQQHIQHMIPVPFLSVSQSICHTLELSHNGTTPTLSWASGREYSL